MLFIILIAIALLAALSYAITKGSGGKTSIDREGTVVNAGLMVDTMAHIGADYDRYKLTVPSVKLNGGGHAPCASGTNCFWVDNPNTSQTVQVGTTAYPVYNNSSNQNRGVIGLGTSAGEDMVYLTNVPLDICTEIDRRLNIGAIPVNTQEFPATSGVNTTTALTGCFQNTTGEYIYYLVLGVF